MDQIFQAYTSLVLEAVGLNYQESAVCFITRQKKKNKKTKKQKQKQNKTKKKRFYAGCLHFLQ